MAWETLSFQTTSFACSLKQVVVIFRCLFHCWPSTWRSPVSSQDALP